MDVQLKQRVVGAAVLAALAVIFVPVLLDDSRRHEPAPLPPPATVVPDPAHARLPDAPSSQAVDEIQRGMTATTEELAGMPVETRVPPEQEGAGDEPMPAPQKPAGGKASAAKTGAGDAAAKRPEAAKPADQWIVQLGTFASEANAVSLQAKLKQAGIATILARPEQPGKSYRLHAGPLPSKEKAETLRKRLEKDFDLKGIVKRQP